MGQKGVEIWANRLNLQPVHGKSDTLLAACRSITELAASYHKVTERKNKRHSYQLINQIQEDNTYSKVRG
jgi:hypothetical protein